MLTLVALLVLVVSTVGAVWIQGIPYYGLAFQPAEQVDATRITILIVCMLLGVIFSHLRPALVEQKTAFTALRAALNSKTLWRSLMASPVVFGVVYASCASQPDLVLAGIFAFENGFFCEAIFQQRAASHGVQVQLDTL